MTLLSLERVTKRQLDGGRERTLLDAVSLEVEPGEIVAVWGQRRSGRSTLLRIAGGLDRPDEGAARFDGRDLASVRDDVLGDEIGYTRARMSRARPVIEQLAGGLLARGMTRSRARARAYELLERVAAAQCAQLDARALGQAELVRVTIARALMLRPRLLLVDEPTTGVDVLERDPILRLLHSLAGEGVAILMTAAETPELTGARALWLNDGRLHGDATPTPAAVLALRPRAS